MAMLHVENDGLGTVLGKTSTPRAPHWSQTFSGPGITARPAASSLGEPVVVVSAVEGAWWATTGKAPPDPLDPASPRFVVLPGTSRVIVVEGGHFVRVSPVEIEKGAT